MGRGGFTFFRRERVKKKREFEAVYHGGQKRVGRFFVLYWRNNGLPFHRLGVTASKKIGGAVVRNRIKRIFREAFRQMRPPVEDGVGVDFVLVARKKIRYISTDAFVGEYRRLLRLEDLVGYNMGNTE